MPESLELKAKVFSTVHQHAPAHAILASNTSSLSITELGARLGAEERTVGLHFFNPPRYMKLLELVTGPDTSAETLGRVRHLGEEVLGKGVEMMLPFPLIDELGRPRGGHDHEQRGGQDGGESVHAGSVLPSPSTLRAWHG